MIDKNAEATDKESLQTITDDQIVTERKVPRRSFLSTTGALLAGAAGIVSGVRASSFQNSSQDDPDKKKPADPDKKPADPDKKPADPDKKPADPDKKPADPDKKPADPDKKPADPDKPPVGRDRRL
jgi:outer membrane biosynthesis protein TonB